MRRGITALLLKVCKVGYRNMSLLRLPESVMSLYKVIATVFWDAERIVLSDYLEHGNTIIRT